MAPTETGVAAALAGAASDASLQPGNKRLAATNAAQIRGKGLNVISVFSVLAARQQKTGCDQRGTNKGKGFECHKRLQAETGKNSAVYRPCFAGFSASMKSPAQQRAASPAHPACPRSTATPAAAPPSCRSPWAAVCRR